MIEIMNMHEVKPTEPWDVIVDRRSALGNDHPMGRHEALRDVVCDQYEESFRAWTEYGGESHSANMMLHNLKLRLKKYGKLRLFCWCAPKRCHAETIKDWLERNL